MNEETKNIQEEPIPDTAAMPATELTPRSVPKLSFRIAAWLMFPAAYLYIEWLLSIWWVDYNLEDCFSETGLFAAFVVFFIGITELVHHKKPTSRESFVWLGCVLVTTTAYVLERGNAVSEFARPSFFYGIFAVWWVLCRADVLTAGESGAFLPSDAFNGFVRFPIVHLFLRLKTVWQSIVGMIRFWKRSIKGVLGGMAGVILAFLLLTWAFSSLMAADTGFERAASRLTEWLERLFSNFDFDFYFYSGGWEFFISLPVGAYLFGLIGGASLENREAISERGVRIREGLEKLRLVPEKVWSVCVGAFCALYAAFFCLQLSYLFGAFVRKLPEGFVVAEYARQGFFELCRVMGINFVLLWLARRTAVTESSKGRLMCTLLMVCSMVFAVISLSKLGLYISCFGFTPRRLLSTWMALVLLFGSVCAVYSLQTGKKSFRAWMMFGAVSLSLLCLY